MRQQRLTSGGRRGNLYELFVLGELIGGPHHGYLLREILDKILGPFRKMSWGALYPLIHRLEEQGLVALDTRAMSKARAAQGKSSARNLYRITKAGKQRFAALMTLAVPFTEYEPELFLAKLGYFDFITESEQEKILEHHLSYLRATDEFIRSSLRNVMANDEIPETERARISWVTQFRLLRVESEMNWVNAELKKRKE